MPRDPRDPLTPPAGYSPPERRSGPRDGASGAARAGAGRPAAARPGGSEPAAGASRPGVPGRAKPSGEEVRAARRARVRMIRRRVATGALVSFLAAWGAVYAQMRLGDDPALGTGTAVAQVDSATSSSSANTLATTDDTSTDSAASSDDSAASSDDSTAASSDDSSTMVTAQS
jgi:hypothetical protein